MAKLLVVDDEPDIHRLVRRYAEREGHEVTEADDGTKAVELCKNEEFDMIIMDAMMPDMDGFTAVKEIKKFSDVPVLMLSARGSEFDKLFGFETGVDDYVVKPFSPKELMARVNVIVSRHKKATATPAESPELSERLESHGKLSIDAPGREAYVCGEKITLTMKEYDLLIFLIKNEGIVLTREQILNSIWGYEYDGEDRTVDWQVKLLRGKLGECRDYVVTVRGVGYKFEVDDEKV